MERISSRQNAVVKRLRELAREGPSGGEVLLEGTHLLEEALAAGVELRLVAVRDDRESDGMRAHAGALVDRGIRVVTLAPGLVDSASPVRQPSGVLAIAALEPASVADVLSSTPALVLALDRVQDPGNVGAIIRAAEAFGATGVFAGPGTADPLGWKALRGAMGSTFRLPVASVRSLEDALDAARSAGLRTFATVPRGGTPPHLAPLAGPSLVLLGGEGAGLPPELIAAADERLTIGMRPPVESLNVAVAAALIGYEAGRQRTNVTVR